jgi:hypothetical protein
MLSVPLVGSAGARATIAGFHVGLLVEQSLQFGASMRGKAGSVGLRRFLALTRKWRDADRQQGSILFEHPNQSFGAGDSEFYGKHASQAW